MELYHYQKCGKPCCGRSSKYVVAVYEAILKIGHATNNDILAELSAEYPNLSATTVHRITARLLERGKIKLVPSGPDLERRFDATLEPHDHFKCDICGKIKDIELGKRMRRKIQRKLGCGCEAVGALTVSGAHRRCQEQERRRCLR